MGDNYIAIKLVTGEEIIAIERGGSGDEGSITIEKPLQLQLAPAGPNGQMGIAMLPWPLSAEHGEMDIRSAAIVTTVHESQMSKQLIDAYKQRVCPIDLSASAGSIIGK